MLAYKGAEENIMTNLQVTGIDDDLYDQLKNQHSMKTRQLPFMLYCNNG